VLVHGAFVPPGGAPGPACRQAGLPWQLRTSRPFDPRAVPWAWPVARAEIAPYRWHASVFSGMLPRSVACFRVRWHASAFGGMLPRSVACFRVVGGSMLAPWRAFTRAGFLPRRKRRAGSTWPAIAHAEGEQHPPAEPACRQAGRGLPAGGEREDRGCSSPAASGGLGQRRARTSRPYLQTHNIPRRSLPAGRQAGGFLPVASVRIGGVQAPPQAAGLFGTAPSPAMARGRTRVDQSFRTTPMTTPWTCTSVT
jgi:hypothetical protein